MARKWKMWAIKGRVGLYCGTWHTRGDAIVDHCRAFGRDWGYMSATHGDRAIRVEIRELPRKRKGKP